MKGTGFTDFCKFRKPLAGAQRTNLRVSSHRKVAGVTTVHEGETERSRKRLRNI